MDIRTEEKGHKGGRVSHIERNDQITNFPEKTNSLWLTVCVEYRTCVNISTIETTKKKKKKKRQTWRRQNSNTELQYIPTTINIYSLGNSNWDDVCILLYPNVEYVYKMAGLYIVLYSVSLNCLIICSNHFYFLSSSFFIPMVSTYPISSVYP
jgi:hypothetical protein